MVTEINMPDSLKKNIKILS